MKKITLLSLFVFMFTCFSFSFVGCNKDNKIRINEVTHSIFYAPLYVAINNGYFEDDGYEIELTNGGGSDASMTALLSGSADIALMGPETNVYVVAQGSTAPVIFGQLTKRDGSFLVGRNPEPDFNWSNLNDKYFIAGRRGGSPAMSLQYALEKNGYNIKTDLTFDLDVSFNNTVSAFESGIGDYVTMFEPTASDYVANGKGYIVASVGKESGEIPFTCFSATSKYIEKNPKIIEIFLKNIVKAYNFIMTNYNNNNMTAIVNSLKPSFEATSNESIERAIKNYIEIDAWVSTPVMQQTAFNRLLEMLEFAGELDQNVQMNSVVNNTYATKVMQTYYA